MLARRGGRLLVYDDARNPKDLDELLPRSAGGTGRGQVLVTSRNEQAIRPGSDEVHFTVYDLDDLAPVGTALLVRVNHHAGAAEFGITIGDRRNQGLGTEATRLVLDWAFTVMGLHNVMLVTFSWNLPAIRAYTKAGFQEIGRRRGAVVTMGQRYDQVLMDAVAEEFSESVLARHAPSQDWPPGRP